MTWTLVAHTAAHKSATPLTTTGINTTGSDLIVIIASSYSGNTDPTITDSNSNTITSAGTAPTAGGLAREHIWYIKSPTVGAAHTFTATNGQFLSLHIMAFSGSDTTAPLDQYNSAGVSSASSVQPGSVTPTTDGQLLITGLTSGETSGSIMSIDSGFSIVDWFTFSSGSWFATASAYAVQATAAAINPTWSWTGSSYAATAIASFKAAAGTDANVNLSGTSTTSAAGSLTANVEPALTGTSSTGAVGSLVITTTGSVSLTGVSSTSAAGAITVEVDASTNLTGVEATGEVGSLALSDLPTLSGVSTTSAVGSLTVTATPTPIEPVYTIMRSTAVPSDGTMASTVVAAEGAFL